MKRLILLISGFVFLTGCSSMLDNILSETLEKEESTEVVAEEPQDNEEEGISEEGFWTNYGVDTIEEFYELPEIVETLTIPTIDIDSLFGEDGNYKYEHTEREVVEKFMDEEGRIYFDFDEHPIRSVKEMDNNISHIMNYSDAYIDTIEAKAYVLPDDMIDGAYTLFISNPPSEVNQTDTSAYRSWEEATNLERAIIQIVNLTGPLINDLGVMIENDLYESSSFDYILNEFYQLGSPTVIIPAPQTFYDTQLYENMQMMHALWGEVGKFEYSEDRKEEFDELYTKLRQETNNLIVRVNRTLSEDLD
ncbi:hypothetical protein SPD48_16800 [Pseudogracilibacillus sp. SE30717A]|uniref:hypothetical protein n=1 Tax=Pseudogracilibacillus sp. SE30717A TaxID=3098293 RepID=UPI00300E0505